MVNGVINGLKNELGGKYDANSKPNPIRQLQHLKGGALLKMPLHKLYSDLEKIKATQDYSDMVIERAIVMHEGDNIPGFPSADVFYYLIQP